MQPFKTKEDYQQWIESQDWYQTIDLQNGLRTPGKVQTQERVEFFNGIDFKGKTVLDIGCNSGHYSLLAKKNGAKKVVGIDVNQKRIEQARTLALNEGLDVEFRHEGIFDIGQSADESFDIVICIAVLTEIPDLFGSIERIKAVTKEKAIIELDIAKPLVYFSLSKNWLRGNPGVSRQKALAEVRYSKNGGWVISPTIQILEKAFGEHFSISEIGKSTRYDLIQVQSIK